jgi:hypothetical protein
LDLSTDELLGVMPAKRAAPHGNSHLARRLKQLGALPPSDQKAILKVIDALIAQHAGKRAG